MAWAPGRDQRAPACFMQLSQGHGRRVDRIAADGEAGLQSVGVAYTRLAFAQVDESLLHGWQQR